MDRTHAEIITALSLAAVAVFVAFAFRVARVGDRHRAEYAAARVTAVLGTAFLLTAIAYAANPSIVSRSPLGHALDPFAWVPYAFYGLGGILAVIAVTRHVRELEAAALVALGTGWRSTRSRSSPCTPPTCAGASTPSTSCTPPGACTSSISGADSGRPTGPHRRRRPRRDRRRHRHPVPVALQRDLNLANAAGRLVDASDVLATNLQEDLAAARAELAGRARRDHRPERPDRRAQPDRRRRPRSGSCEQKPNATPATQRSGRCARNSVAAARETPRMTPKKLEDDLVEVVSTLVIEVALHQRRMRRAIRLGVLGLVLIAAAFAGAVYLAVDTRTVVSRSPCVNLRAPSCFRKLVTNASPRTLAILKRRLAAQERRARQRENAAA
jgi:hypothetical protein